MRPRKPQPPQEPDILFDDTSFFSLDDNPETLLHIPLPKKKKEELI